MHPDDLFAADRYRDAVETGDSYSAEYRLIDVDGRVRWFRDDAAPVRDASGTARFMQGVIFEVTDQKENEAQLLESEQRFRELLENVRLAAITTDLEGRIVFVNEYFAELSGWWDDELLGRSWVETFVAGEGSDGERAFLAELAQGRVIPHREGAILTRTRETRLFSWNATPLRDSDGTVTGSAWIGEDITDRRKAEQELARLAYHDSLTGLPNRVLFQEHLELALARAERTGTGVAVLYVDLDDFKLVNDSFGHGAGDELLCEVANRLRLSTRSSRRGRPPGRRRVPDPDRRLRRRGPADARHRRGRPQGGRGAARGAVAADGAGRHRDLHQRQHRHQPVPGRRERRRAACSSTPTSRCTRPRSRAATGTSCSPPPAATRGRSCRWPAACAAPSTATS